MIKLPENKTRKKLRITQCVLYLFEIVFCTFPYIQGQASDGYLYSHSVFSIISYWGATVPDTMAGAAFQTYAMFMPIFVVVPIVGFFFCALDKQRNMKNVVSIICCLIGVVAILMIVNRMLSLGSLLALLVYLVICFITTMAMFARISDKTTKNENTEETKK